MIKGKKVETPPPRDSSAPVARVAASLAEPKTTEPGAPTSLTARSAKLSAASPAQEPAAVPPEPTALSEPAEPPAAEPHAAERAAQAGPDDAPPAEAQSPESAPIVGVDAVVAMPRMVADLREMRKVGDLNVEAELLLLMRAAGVSRAAEAASRSTAAATDLIGKDGQ